MVKISRYFMLEFIIAGMESEDKEVKRLAEEGMQYLGFADIKELKKEYAAYV